MNKSSPRLTPATAPAATTPVAGGGPRAAVSLSAATARDRTRPLRVIPSMKPAAFALLLLAAVPTAAPAKPRPSLLPPGWTEVYADAASRTRRFKSADGEVTLTARQTPAGRDRAADLDEIAFRPGETITYQRRARSWIAVSGYRGDDIFYRKSNLACGGRRWNNVEFIYPRADKKRLDAMVTAVARDMTGYGEECG
jgi:hypothetical protein